MFAKTFVFCHDQKIMLEIEQKQNLIQLPNLTWVMLGFNNFDKIKNKNNVIISNSLNKNIEHYKYLFAWTGWYSLYENGLIIDGDVVNFFEYDIELLRDWEQKKQCAYFHMDTNETWWNPHFGGNDFKKNLVSLVGVDDKAFHNSMAPSTSNYTLNFKGEYLEPITKLISLGIADSRMGGHILERVYSHYFSGIDFQHGMIKHNFMKSHGTY